jgi:hypothetical protein
MPGALQESETDSVGTAKAASQGWVLTLNTSVIIVSCAAAASFLTGHRRETQSAKVKHTYGHACARSVTHPRSMRTNMSHQSMLSGKAAVHACEPARCARRIVLAATSTWTLKRRKIMCDVADGAWEAAAPEAAGGWLVVCRAKFIAQSD